MIIAYAPGAIDGFALETSDYAHNRLNRNKEIEQIVAEIEGGSTRHADIGEAAGTDNLETIHLYLMDNYSTANTAILPAGINLLKQLVDGQPHMVTDLNLGKPEPGAYISEDYRTPTLVKGCAQSSSDEDATSLPQFPNGEGKPFASLNIGSMRNGSIVVRDGGVEKYVRDSNGDWING